MTATSVIISYYTAMCDCSTCAQKKTLSDKKNIEARRYIMQIIYYVRLSFSRTQYERCATGVVAQRLHSYRRRRRRRRRIVDNARVAVRVYYVCGVISCWSPVVSRSRPAHRSRQQK